MTDDDTGRPAPERGWRRPTRREAELVERLLDTRPPGGDELRLQWRSALVRTVSPSGSLAILPPPGAPPSDATSAGPVPVRARSPGDLGRVVHVRLHVRGGYLAELEVVADAPAPPAHDAGRHGPSSAAAPGRAEPRPDALLATVALRVDELRDAGATVVLSPDPMAPDVLATLSQQLPNGPLMVQVDATKPLALQRVALGQAYEYLFDAPPAAPWRYRSVTTGTGGLLSFRTVDLRTPDLRTPDVRSER